MELLKFYCVWAFLLLRFNTTGGFTSSSSRLRRQHWLQSGVITHLFESPSHKDGTRDMTSLKDWALANGVQLMAGVELAKDSSSEEWGVAATRPLPDTFQGLREVTIMSIPASLVLSSADIQNPSIGPALAAHGMGHYAPEFCLFWILLLEHSKGERSLVYPWIQSLPKQIATAIYFDETERVYARQLGAGYFLDHQDAQWGAFQQCLQQVFPDHSFPLELQKWAYAVVLTRSWRTSFSTPQGEAVANLVPMGDLFNHNGVATVLVKQETAEDAVAIHRKRTTTSDREEGLSLNYGYPEHPDRFLMVFGFVDTSSSVVCASSVLELFEGDNDAGGMGFQDSSQMTFSTEDGSVSEALWNGVLYKILQWQLQNDPGSNQLSSDLETLQRACATMNDPMSDPNLIEVHRRHRQEAADSLRHEVEGVLEGQFGPIPDFTREDYSAHPRIETLTDYHQYMRSVYQRVHQFLMETPE